MRNLFDKNTSPSLQELFVRDGETGRFDTNSSSEIAQTFCSLQVWFASEQEKQYGAYSLS